MRWAWAWGGLGPDATLREARESMEEALGEGDGATCPCCGSWNRVYRRRLNRAKVRELLAIYRWADEHDSLYDYLHVPSTGISLRNREYPKLRWWGLIEAREAESGGGVSSGEGTGWWRLTPQGVAFVRGEVRLPNRVLEFRSRVVGWDVEAVAVDVHAALRDTSVDPDEREEGDEG